MNTHNELCWIEINKSHLHHNIQQFWQWLEPNTSIAGVIKSNAYGHGIDLIASLYQQHKNISHICVVHTTEAVHLRNIGITKPIIVIGYCNSSLQEIIDHNIEIALYNLNFATKLNKIAQSNNHHIKVHIKIDTGLSRLGIMPHEVDTFITKMNNFSHLHIVSLFSHFSQGENKEITHQQEDIFQKHSLHKFPMHTSNSHGIMTTKYNNYTIARIGLGLYGYLPGHQKKIHQQLKPVLSIKTKILQIKSIQKNSFIGYDQTFQAPTDMKIAIIPFGYYEGFDVRLSNKGYVIINDQKASIVGKISMNLTIVDITHIQNCNLTTPVTILGQTQTISCWAYDWAKITESSPYELITKINQNIPRYIVEK